MKLKNKKGFSLVELLVVITIIAILSVVAYTAVGGQTVKARDSKRKQDLNTIQQALEIYFAEMGTYPNAPLTNGTGAGEIPKKYLSDIPQDPGTAGHSYLFVKSGATYQIAATLEKDGEPAHYEAYVVGNSDGVLVKTADSLGKYYNIASSALDTCINGWNIEEGPIGNSDADGNCIPYDPLN